MPSSRGFSWPRDRTCVSCVSCINRQIVHHRATWEAPHLCSDGALKLSVLLAPVRAVTVVHFLFRTVLPSNISISFFNMNLSDNAHWYFFFPLVQRAYSPNQYLSLRSIEMLFYFTDYKEKHDLKKKSRLQWTLRQITSFSCVCVCVRDRDREKWIGRWGSKV